VISTPDRLCYGFLALALAYLAIIALSLVLP